MKLREIRDIRKRAVENEDGVERRIGMFDYHSEMMWYLEKKIGGIENKDDELEKEIRKHERLRDKIFVELERRKRVG